ncbi:MAG: MFS transporter [Gammaproteobacteria bacterium]
MSNISETNVDPHSQVNAGLRAPKLSSWNAIFIFILTALFLCYEMGVQVSPSVMTQYLMHDLGISALQLGFMSGFYYYTYTLMQIPAGLLFDRFKIHYVIVIPLVVVAIGALLFSFSQGILLGSVGRLCMGTGSAFAFIAVLVVASDLFPEKYFALLVGLTQMLAAFGAMLGEAPLVPLIHHLSWRGAMQLLAVVAIILAVSIWLFVRYEKCNQVKGCDAESVSILKSLKIILSNKQSWFVAFYACCLWAPMAAFASLWGVPFLETVYGLSKIHASEMITLMWLGIAIASPLLGWFSDAIGSRRIPLAFSALIGIVAFFILDKGFDLSPVMIGLLVFLGGAACSGQALSFAVVRDNNPSHTMAAAIGFNNMAVVIAGAVFQPLVAYVIGDQSIAHFEAGISIITGCFFVGLLLALFFLKAKPTSLASK